MAEHSITFKIGSVFTGEGFKKAQNTINTMNSEMKKGIGTVQQMSGCLGQIDTSSSKAATAMAGMLQALMSMNVTVIASQASIMALNFVMSEMVKKYDEIKKKAEEVKVSVEKAFSSALSERISSVNSEVKSVADKFENLTKHANQFAAALEGVRNAEANGGVIQLQVDKLNSLLEAHSDEERENIEAAYNLKIAIQKSADSATAWQAKIDAAHQAVVDNENRMASIDEQIAIVSEERKSLEDAMISAKSSGDSNYLEIQKQINSLWEQEMNLEQKKIDAEAQTDVLRLEEQRVKAEANNAQAQATIEIKNAELAETKLTEAKDARKSKEEAAKEAADQKASADILDAQETENAADIQKRLNDASKALQQAEEAYAQKLNEYNSSDLIMNALRDFVKKGGDQGLLPVDVQKGIQLRTADSKVDDAIRSGVVNTVKEADRLQRLAMRQARNEIARQQRQQLNEAKKYKRLQEMNPKTICSADKDFMAKYEKIQKAADERKKQLAEAKKAVEDQKENVKKTRENLDAIKKKLENLGLK